MRSEFYAAMLRVPTSLDVLTRAAPLNFIHCSPLKTRVWPRNANFVSPGEEMVQVQIVRPGTGLVGGPPRAFLAAGKSHGKRA